MIGQLKGNWLFKTMSITSDGYNDLFVMDTDSIFGRHNSVMLLRERGKFYVIIQINMLPIDDSLKKLIWFVHQYISDVIRMIIIVENGLDITCVEREEKTLSIATSSLTCIYQNFTHQQYKCDNAIKPTDEKKSIDCIKASLIHYFLHKEHNWVIIASDETEDLFGSKVEDLEK